MGRPDFGIEQSLMMWRKRLRQNEGLSDLQVDELEDHLRELIAEERLCGRQPREAFRQAVARLGHAGLLENVFRAEEERRVSFWQRLVPQLPGPHEIQYAVRRLVRHSGFSFSAVLILALGIGVNTAIFSVVHAVLLRPLPFPEPGQLVRVWASSPERDREFGAFSFPDLIDWSERSSTMSEMGLFTTLVSDLVWTGEGQAQELATAYVTPGFFRTLGAVPELGKSLLSPEEDSTERQVVISHQLWIDRFGGDREILGRKLTLNQEPYQVVGVMPAAFRYPDPEIELWCYLGVVPQSSAPWKLRQVRFLEAIGRLASGKTIRQAEEELGTVARQLAQEFSDTNASISAANLEPLDEVITGPRVRESLWMLAGAVGLILLIACANVANLVIARGITRRRELAVRKALGASRGRLIGQLLLESLLLAAVAGALGILVAYLGIKALLLAAGGFLPRAYEVQPDFWLLGLSLVLSLIAGVLSGLAPALTTSAAPPNLGLHSDDRGSSGSSQWLRSGLVITEVALAVVLLIGAGLLLRSVWQRYQVDPGFESDGLLTVSMTISRARSAERPSYLAFYHQVLERLQTHPQIEAAGSIRYFPMRGIGEQVPWEAVGESAAPGSAPRTAYLLQVSPGLFEALKTPLLAGRTLQATDLPPMPARLVINRSLAREAFSSERAAGRFLRINDESYEVVGVVEDIRQSSVDEPAPPTVYLLNEQSPRRGMSFVLRARTSPEALIPVVRDLFREVDPDQALTEVAPAREILQGNVALPSLFAWLLACLAGLAILLAALGIYSLIAYSVNYRTREIGIRMALGAGRASTRWMVLRQGLRPVLAGMFLGVLVALAASRLLAGQLFGVAGTDPGTYLGVGLLIGLVALPGCLIPAIRATRIDPVQALRHE